jgi:hypothetical protein
MHIVWVQIEGTYSVLNLGKRRDSGVVVVVVVVAVSVVLVHVVVGRGGGDFSGGVRRGRGKTIKDKRNMN